MTMRAHVTVLLAFAALLAPTAHADGEGEIDVRVVLRAGDAPDVSDPAALVLLEHEPGERYAWRLVTTTEYTTLEFRVLGAFDVERPRQVVPTLLVPGIDYPLFHEFANERVWDVDSPGRVVNVTGTVDDVLIRLGVPGPVNATLELARDVTAPSVDVGPVRNLTYGGFFRESSTDELALVDLQVRARGDDEWIRNPTTVYHYLQRFPVQGLDEDTEHEVRALARDWAGNVAEVALDPVRTPPRPVVPEPLVTPLAPAPDSRQPDGALVVSARIESPESPVPATGVRLFVDAKEVFGGWAVEGDTLRYAPPTPFEPGMHSVRVEAVNALGGRTSVRWAFEVADAGVSAEAAGPGALALAAVALAAAVAPRRPRA